MKRGAIADDFTGATDLAGNWQSRGLRTSVLIGIPDGSDLEAFEDDDAIVIALKSRSTSSSEAVRVSELAAAFLLNVGCQQIYQKFCSTFDSTAEGNIGPVAEMLLNLTQAEQAVVVPSFPDNGRTVYQGNLFVWDQLLNESPMRNHPLTPMLDSNVVRLLEAQTVNQVGHVPLQTVNRGVKALSEALVDCRKQGRRLIVVDAVNNDDLAIIAEATADAPLVTGGSGLGLGLPKRTGAAVKVQAVPGRRVVLSGSASEATRMQVQLAQKHFAHQRLDLERLQNDASGEVERLVTWAQQEWTLRPDKPVLVYSTANAQDLAQGQELGHWVPSATENALAALGNALSEAGATQFIVAGGETSGAVLEELGVRRLAVGQQISPGVSWLEGVSKSGRRHNFVLKSGNFGSEKLLVDGWEWLE